jgi:HSP20 family protein
MNALSRWQPFRELTSLQERVNQLFSEAFPGMETSPTSALGSTWFAPRTDVYEEDDRIVLEMEAPGVREEDINITLENNMLTVTGERKFEEGRKQDRYQRVERYYGNFSRSFTLPATVDPNSVEAKYENGILRVTMTKKAEAKPRQIKVGTAQGKQLSGKAA